MESAKIEEVFRAQGSVGSLDLVLGLEEDLLEYQKAIRDGKAKPIQEVASV